MLRFSSANVLRSSVGRRAAVRTVSAPAWTRNICNGLSGRASSLTLRRVAVGTQQGVWRPSVAGVRNKSTAAHDEEVEPSHEKDESFVPKNPRAPRTGDQKHTFISDADALLMIAAGRSTRQVKKEMDVGAVSRKLVQSELRWLKDPRMLADRVGRSLTVGHVAVAAELVRGAQREGMECMVGWNHLMDYCAKRGHMRPAFRFYNDMKKRGRMPNSQTYTIMLDGFAKASGNIGLKPVRTALGVYRSIFKPDNRVEANVIHSNAMLQVCKNHRDMDMLWQVAGELPEDGPGSPDAVSYTIILSALQDQLNRDLTSGKLRDAKQVLLKQKQVNNDAKRVWTDVLYRWVKGQLKLDSVLVARMAAVLLEGPGERSCYDVLKLYNQVAGIPIFAQEPPATAPNSHFARLRDFVPQNNQEAEDVPFVDEGGQPYVEHEDNAETSEIQEAEEQEEQENFDNVLDPITPTKASSSTPEYLALSNRDLSMIMETCLSMTQSLNVAKAYWEYLTGDGYQHKFQPDTTSFLHYLRILRVNRSSRTSLELIRDQMAPSLNMNGVAFHIALSCCRRDRQNPNVLIIANELLKLMDTNLVLSDPKALLGYLDLIRILEDNPQFLLSLSGLGIETNQTNRSYSSLGSRGRELTVSLKRVAIEALRPHVAQLDEALKHGKISKMGSPMNLKRWRQQHGGIIETSLVNKVLVQMRGLLDDVLKPENASLLSKEDRKQYEQESKALRDYSKAEVMEHLRNCMVAPTQGQVEAYHDRVGDKHDFGDRPWMDGTTD